MCVMQSFTNVDQQIELVQLTAHFVAGEMSGRQFLFTFCDFLDVVEQGRNGVGWIACETAMSMVFFCFGGEKLLSCRALCGTALNWVLGLVEFGDCSIIGIYFRQE